MSKAGWDHWEEMKTLKELNELLPGACENEFEREFLFVKNWNEIRIYSNFIFNKKA